MKNKQSSKSIKAKAHAQPHVKNSRPPCKLKPKAK